MAHCNLGPPPRLCPAGSWDGRPCFIPLTLERQNHTRLGPKQCACSHCITWQRNGALCISLDGHPQWVGGSDEQHYAASLERSLGSGRLCREQAGQPLPAPTASRAGQVLCSAQLPEEEVRPGLPRHGAGGAQQRNGKPFVWRKPERHPTDAHTAGLPALCSEMDPDSYTAVWTAGSRRKERQTDRETGKEDQRETHGHGSVTCMYAHIYIYVLCVSAGWETVTYMCRLFPMCIYITCSYLYLWAKEKRCLSIDDMSVTGGYICT